MHSNTIPPFRNSLVFQLFFLYCYQVYCFCLHLYHSQVCSWAHFTSLFKLCKIQQKTIKFFPTYSSSSASLSSQEFISLRTQGWQLGLRCQESEYLSSLSFSSAVISLHPASLVLLLSWHRLVTWNPWANLLLVWFSYRSNPDSTHHHNCWSGPNWSSLVLGLFSVAWTRPAETMCPRWVIKFFINILLIIVYID